MSGPGAVVTGAVLYTAARALFIRAQRASQQTASDERATATDPSPPSLALPNQRWTRLAAERR